MKVSSFWNIVIKIIGLFLTIDLIPILPQFVMTIYTQIIKNEFVSSLFIIVILIFYFLTLRVLFFKTDWIIKKLKLNDGFNEDSFSLNIPRNTVLNIAIILIGAIFLINSIPELVEKIQIYFREKSMFYDGDYEETPDKSWIMLHLIQCVIGFLAIRNSKKLANFIESKNSDETNSEILD